MKEQLPGGWQLAAVGDVASYVRGVTYQKEHARGEPGDGLVPVLRANNIGSSLNFEDLVYVPSRFVSQEQRIRDGDVVIAMSSGSKSVVGKAAKATNPPEIGFGAFCGVLRPNEKMDASYLGFYFQTKAYRNRVSELSKGVNINNLKAEHLLDQPLPLPPAAEQRRIVSRIEELFSEIDEGERALERVQKLVERYRQSVLRAAVTGELTREWRDWNGRSAALTEDSARHVLDSRRTSWDQARNAGLLKQSVYPVPALPVHGAEIDVPATWAVVSVEAVTLAQRPIAYGVLQPGPDVEGGVPLVRVCDIADGKVDLASLKRVAPDVVAPFPRTRLRGGEVLVTIVGTIGRTGIVPKELSGANVARAVAVLSPQPAVRAGWLALCLREERMRQLMTETSREVARKTLNLEQLRECAIPVPSLDEQDKAISVVGSMLSRAQAVASDVHRQIVATRALRQATLKAAFSGQLVPQDPTDEPASALLARLAAQGSETVPAPRRRGRQAAPAHP